jgi:hypothetical protein
MHVTHLEEAPMKDNFTKILASVGGVMVWFPLLAPFITSAVTLVRAGRLWFDYLLPGELFPVAFFGGLLLLWAAIRARARRLWIGLSLGLAVVFLVAGQGLAMVSGLASGSANPTGWAWPLVLISLAVYALALAVLGVGGVLLSVGLGRPAAST